MHGDEAAPVSGIHQTSHDKDAPSRPTPRPAEVGPIGNAGQAGRRTEGFGGLKNDTDDFAEAERDDGEIIATQTQGGNTDGEASRSGDHSAEQ